LPYLGICNGVVSVHATIALAPDAHVGGGRAESATSPRLPLRTLPADRRVARG